MQHFLVCLLSALVLANFSQATEAVTQATEWDVTSTLFYAFGAVALVVTHRLAGREPTRGPGPLRHPGRWFGLSPFIALRRRRVSE